MAVGGLFRFRRRRWRLAAGIGRKEKVDDGEQISDVGGRRIERQLSGCLGGVWAVTVTYVSVVLMAMV